jgi:hypothetical protein
VQQPTVTSPPKMALVNSDIGEWMSFWALQSQGTKALDKPLSRKAWSNDEVDLAGSAFSPAFCAQRGNVLCNRKHGVAMPGKDHQTEIRHSASGLTVSITEGVLDTV